MNYKKLLAYSLAAACVLNTPTTLFAAERQMPYQNVEQNTEEKKFSVITDLPKQLEADIVTAQQQEQLKELTQLAKTDPLAAAKQLNRVLEENSDNVSFSEKAIRSVLDVYFGQEPFDEGAVQIVMSQCATNDMVYAKMKDYYGAKKEREDVYWVNDMEHPGKKLPVYDEKHIRVYFESDIGEEVIGKLADYLCASHEKAECWDPLEEGTNLSVMRVTLRLDQTTKQATDLFKQYAEIESAGICSYIYPAGGVNEPSDSIGQTEDQTDDQSQVNDQIDRIEIVPGIMEQGQESENCYYSGAHINFQAKVYMKDGTVAVGGKNAQVTCELRKKDGTQPQAVCNLINPVYPIPEGVQLDDRAFADIRIYAPYNYAEELELVVRSVHNKNVSASYNFQTITTGTDETISLYDTGITAGKVTVKQPKESWNAADGTYRVVLPEVIAENKADQFVGWKNKKGKVYAAGKTVTVKNQQPYKFKAVWKTKTGTNFTLDVKQKVPYSAQYTVTGKKTVAFVKPICIIKTFYPVNIPDTVEFHNETYKVTSIAASAFRNTSVRKLVIGKNVTKLDKNIFGKNRFLKRIVIQSEQIKSVAKNAMKGITQDTVIQCPKAKVKAYTKLFRKAGLNKKVTIKGV